jgi:hypothetical protein
VLVLQVERTKVLTVQILYSTQLLLLLAAALVFMLILRVPLAVLAAAREVTLAALLDSTTQVARLLRQDKVLLAVMLYKTHQKQARAAVVRRQLGKIWIRKA